MNAQTLIAQGHAPARWWSAQRFYKFALHPWTVIGALALGSAFGMFAPAAARPLALLGSIYVDLLKMIVLPFMVSAVIFSLQRMFKEGGAGKVLARVAWVFVGFSIVAALAGAVAMQVATPGSDLSESTRLSFGKIVGSDSSQSNTDMSLKSVDAPGKEVSLRELLASIVPSNIFAALAQGEALKALVFALLFGFAVGQVPARVSEGLTHSLETIYQSCQTLMRWLNYPVPLVLFAMASSQIAETGIEPIKAMGGFVITFCAVTALLVALSLFVIRQRAGQSWAEVLGCMRAPFALAVATRSSAICMPAMIEALADRLGFARSRVELLVPLSVSLLRVGPILYYVSATLFIAQLYNRSLSLPEIGLVMLVSVMAGFASAGMSGLVTLSLVGTTAGYLGLPFEAAFILFVAVDPVCDIARTILIVVANSAAVASVCPKPLQV